MRADSDEHLIRHFLNPQNVKIANPVDITKYEELKLLIDTGATFSVINKERLERLGISPIGKKKLKLANGEIIERNWGIACFIIDNKGEGGADVIFGEKTDTELLGLVTLENMALKINPNLSLGVPPLAG